jgi:polyferredoxin
MARRWICHTGGHGGDVEISTMMRIPLNILPGFNFWVKSRWPQLIIRSALLGGFLIAILAGFLGTPVGNRNISIVAVWIAWWAALILVAVPFFGRGWCSICPIPMPGEWLQNRAVLGPSQKGNSLKEGRRFPKRLRNIWLQNGAFSFLALFSVIILTRPVITAWVLLALILVAIVTSLLYERRVFCRYLCPVGGFIGIYSQQAPLELRVTNSSICATHKEKSCYRGNENGYGCPWDVYPGGLTANTNCGLCMECLRTCEYDNILINLRTSGDTLSTLNRQSLDSSFKAYIMLGSAIVYSAVMLGPWSGLKEAAYQIGSLPWWGYAVGLLVIIWAALPGLFYLVTRVAHKLGPSNQNKRHIFNAYSSVLVPLSLTAWIAFSLSFVFTNGSYLLPVLSDPFGWGWDLFGTSSVVWTPYLSQYIPVLQTIVLTVGLFWTTRKSQEVAKEMKAPRQAMPIVAFCTLIAVSLLWLFVG